MKRPLRAIGLLLAVAFLVGCSAAPQRNEAEFWENGTEESDGGVRKERFSSFTLPFLQGESFDPVSAPDGIQQLAPALMYESLFVLDEQFEPQGILCSGFSKNADATAFTFTLAPGICFSDGSALTADDVAATLNRARTSARYGARLACVTGITASDARTLTISLDRPLGGFPARLDIPIVKAGTETNTVPLGSGPYVFCEDGGEAFLSANEHWWRKLELPLHRIGLIGVKDEDTAFYRFASYEVNLLTADLTENRSAGADLSAEISDTPTGTLLYLGCNVNRSVLTDAGVRSAMQSALNRDEIVKAYLFGHAEAAQFPLSAHSALYPDVLEGKGSATSYRDSVDALVDTPHTLTILVNRENEFKTALASELCAQLSSAKLNVILRALPWEEYRAALAAGNFDLYLGQVRLCADWDCSSLVCTGGALNYGGYSDPQTDALCRAFTAVPTVANAAALCKNLQTRAPILPIAFLSSSVLYPTGLCSGITPTASTPFYGFESWQFTFTN